MSNLNQDRAGVINRISQGLKKNIISGADILALAAESASKKRLEKCQCNQQNINVIQMQKSFEREICDASVKENVVPKLNTFPSSPFKAMEGYYLKTSLGVKERTVHHSEDRDEDVAAIIHEEIQRMDYPLVHDHDQQSSNVSEMETNYDDESGSYVNHADAEETEMQTVNSIDQLKAALTSHLLKILNHGTYEELTDLEGIGKVRAMKIFTKRNSGFVFKTVDDLEWVGFNHKNIQKFVKQNLGAMMC